MKILLIEDETEKVNLVKEIALKALPHQTPVFEVAATYTEGRRAIRGGAYDFIVMDFLLPSSNSDGEKIDHGDNLARAIRSSEYNQRTPVVAVTQYEQVDNERKRLFLEQNIHIVWNQDVQLDWKNAIATFFKLSDTRLRSDFILITALEKEGMAFQEVDGVSIGTRRKVRGLNCREVTVGERSGHLIIQPDMGPICAATITSRCLMEFDSPLYLMSGICGGVTGNANIGDVVLADRAIDYQAGKRQPGGHFDPDGKTISVLPSVLEAFNDYRNEKADEDLRGIALLHENFRNGETLVGAVATGSAVVNDADVVKKDITPQARDALGIDMEIYGVYYAIYSSGWNSNFAAVKTVVDLADGFKNDTFQTQACYISAVISCDIIRRLLT
ncbi:hypothetical protein [Fretibacter rubidus]|uniref:phosphorylase family protein n=1 Tax=Fretibacter rubidus TaxID=570162 RepID=UPI00352A3998